MPLLQIPWVTAAIPLCRNHCVLTQQPPRNLNLFADNNVVVPRLFLMLLLHEQYLTLSFYFLYMEQYVRHIHLQLRVNLIV